MCWKALFCACSRKTPVVSQSGAFTVSWETKCEHFRGARPPGRRPQAPAVVSGLTASPFGGSGSDFYLRVSTLLVQNLTFLNQCIPEAHHSPFSRSLIAAEYILNYRIFFDVLMVQ